MGTLLLKPILSHLEELMVYYLIFWSRLPFLIHSRYNLIAFKKMSIPLIAQTTLPIADPRPVELADISVDDLSPQATLSAITHHCRSRKGSSEAAA